MNYYPRPLVLHVEFALSYVIERSRVRNANVVRRLNGIENTIGALAVEWREWRPILPQRELRLRESTRWELMAWVTASGTLSHWAVGRPAAYSGSGILDESVPAGWVRLLLTCGENAGSVSSAD